MSEIRSILVHADDSPAFAVRLQAAYRLAEQFDATVTATYAATPSPIAFPAGFDAGAEVAAALQTFDIDRRDRAKALVDAAVASSMPRLAWEELPGEPVQAFGHAALYADLVVAGQADPRATMPSVPPDFIELVALASGTATLVVPYIGLPATLGRTALVAWKASRESARAVAAALPLLQAADHVHVALWDSPRSSAAVEAPRIEAWLQRHDVRVTVHRNGHETADLGEQLLSRAADLGADLLVMGCYGHSRAREWMLGGATRSVMRSMTLPVLTAH